MTPEQENMIGEEAAEYASRFDDRRNYIASKLGYIAGRTVGIDERGYYLGEVKSIAKEIAVDFAWENSLDKTKGYQYFRAEYDKWVEENKYINTKLSTVPTCIDRERELEECLKMAIKKYADEMTNPFCMEWYKKAVNLLNNK